MPDLSLKELRAVAKIRDIKDYKSMSKDKLLSMLDKSEQVKKTKAIRDIRKENFDSGKILGDIRTLYESEEDYYEPVRTSSAFNNNYIEYESNGDKDEILSVKEKSMKGSEFVFDSADLLYYKLHKISPSRGGSYIDSPEGIKNKKATVNPRNNDDKCFQYALNFEQIKKDPRRITKIKPFIDQHN